MGAGEILVTGVISIAVLVFDCLVGKFQGHPFHSSKEAAVRDEVIDTPQQLHVGDIRDPLEPLDADLWMSSRITKYLRSPFAPMLLTWVIALSIISAYSVIIISWNMGHVNSEAIDQVNHRMDVLDDKVIILDDRVNLLIENIVAHDIDLIDVNKHQEELEEIAAFISDMNYRLCLESLERTGDRSDRRFCPVIPSKIKMLAAQAER